MTVTVYIRTVTVYTRTMTVCTRTVTVCTSVGLWDSKTEGDAAQSCPMGLSGETVGLD